MCWSLHFNIFYDNKLVVDRNPAHDVWLAQFFPVSQKSPDPMASLDGRREVGLGPLARRRHQVQVVGGQAGRVFRLVAPVVEDGVPPGVSVSTGGARSDATGVKRAPFRRQRGGGETGPPRRRPRGALLRRGGGPDALPEAIRGQSETASCE